MSVKYTFNKEYTVVNETWQRQRKATLESLLASLPAKFAYSELTKKLRDGNFFSTPLKDGFVLIFYDNLALSMRNPVAATLALLPHIGEGLTKVSKRKKKLK